MVEHSSAEHQSPSTYMGPSIGLPSLLSVSLETRLEDKTVFGLQVGSLIYVHSFGARFIFGSNDPGWNFRYFVGAAILDGYGEYESDPSGTSGHGWFGVDYTLNEAKWRFSFETGGLLGGAPDRGFGFSGLTLTWGVSLLHSL